MNNYSIVNNSINLIDSSKQREIIANESKVQDTHFRDTYQRNIKRIQDDFEKKNKQVNKDKTSMELYNYNGNCCKIKQDMINNNNIYEKDNINNKND